MPSVDGIVALIKGEFDDTLQIAEFEKILCRFPKPIPGGIYIFAWAAWSTIR